MLAVMVDEGPDDGVSTNAATIENVPAIDPGRHDRAGLQVHPEGEGEPQKVLVTPATSEFTINRVKTRGKRLRRSGVVAVSSDAWFCVLTCAPLPSTANVQRVVSQTDGIPARSMPVDGDRRTCPTVRSGVVPTATRRHCLTAVAVPRVTELPKRAVRGVVRRGRARYEREITARYARLYFQRAERTWFSMKWRNTPVLKTPATCGCTRRS